MNQRQPRRTTAHVLCVALLASCLLPLTGCGGTGSDADPLPIVETLASLRDAQVTPIIADETSDTALVGRTAGIPSQMVIEFKASQLGRTGSGGVYVDAAMLTVYIAGTTGAPFTNLGPMRIESVQSPSGNYFAGSGLGQPLSGADFDDSGASSTLLTVANVVDGQPLQVDVTGALKEGSGDYIAFRFSFPGSAAAGPDDFVSIFTSRTTLQPVPTLVIDGGLVGL